MMTGRATAQVSSTVSQGNFFQRWAVAGFGKLTGLAMEKTWSIASSLTGSPIAQYKTSALV